MARGISRQLLTLILAASAFAQTKQQRQMMERVSEDSLRANLTYLASDELEGRATPSKGLDMAADFIAEQFKKAKLQPINGSYFQTATLAEVATPGSRIARLTFPEGTPTTMRNVVGLLRGSDKKLRDTYIIVSSHYDHVGLATTGEDRIFNGANDDASGSVSVIELARALSGAKPKRSILFMTFFGEERGMLGSRYYGQHPLVPIASTVAQLNLEQIGRTDASNGPQIKGANLTGYDFTNLPTALEKAAQLAGVRIWKDATSSDAYFSRSDNQSLADLGVPAHTLSVAYDFPDYHKVSDTADKIDYANMATVNRGIALGLLNVANTAEPPQWNESYAPAQKYVEAARKLRAASNTSSTN